MPSKSESQKRLFCMAYAVRKGKLERSKASKAVLDIADGDMTDKQIKDFMVKESTSLKDFIKEGLLFVDPNLKEPKRTANSIKQTPTKYASGFTPVFKDVQKTFIVIKPGFMNMAQKVIALFEARGFKLFETRIKRLLLKEAKQMYKMHKDEDFYKALCEYMSSDITMGITFLPPKDMSQEDMFKLVGELKDEIRKKYSESDMRNVMHSSDSFENMQNEIQFYF